MSEMSSWYAPIGTVALGVLLPLLQTGCAHPPMSDDDTGTLAAAEPDASAMSSGRDGAVVQFTRQATMTRAEWDAARGLRMVSTHVQTRGCAPELINSAYPVLPTVGCSLVDDYDLQTNPVRECVVAPYCVGPQDCTEAERGRCEGVVSTARCIYPPAPDEPCSDDDDCHQFGAGHCADSATNDFLCYPTGECTSPGKYCRYDVQACKADADCDAAPDGRCVMPIEYATCVYDECTDDTHCGVGQRCGCFDCVDASCSSDSDCDAEQACEFWKACGYRGGYECSTNQDECVPGESDCECAFLDGHFQCSRRTCE